MGAPTGTWALLTITRGLDFPDSHKPFTGSIPKWPVKHRTTPIEKANKCNKHRKAGIRLPGCVWWESQPQGAPHSPFIIPQQTSRVVKALITLKPEYQGSGLYIPSPNSSLQRPLEIFMCPLLIMNTHGHTIRQLGEVDYHPGP